MTESSWPQDPKREVRIEPGLLARTVAVLEALGWENWELLSTERALSVAPPGLRKRAAAVHLVESGPVPEVSGALLEGVREERLVAFGGGRVIDSAKAIVAVLGGSVAAVPTTLSGAPITAIHRLPEGKQGLSGVRPSLVLADPELLIPLPEDQLRASAMNALAHGADSLVTPLADERSRSIALRGAGLIASQLDASPDDRDLSELMLGALLGAEALDSAGLALHHVLSQTAVRVLDLPHAEANAALLPHTTTELARRDPERMAALARALGAEPGSLGERIAELGGNRRLSQLGADPARLDEVVETAMARPELEQMTPGPVSAADIERVLAAAM